MDSHSFVIPRAATHKRSLQDGGVILIKSEDEERMAEYEETCIIKIENINRELSPYQKCRLVEEVRKG